MKMKTRLILVSAPALILVTSATTVRSQTSDPGSPDFMQTSVPGLWRDLDGGYWCGGDCGPNQQCCTITITTPEAY